MTRYIYTTICCLILSACNKLPKNGDLDGMWQITYIEHNGIITNVKNYRLYISFQLDLFQLTSAQNDKIYYGYFNRENDNIIFKQISDMAEEHPDIPDNYPITQENISLIKPWGFYVLQDTFNIEKITKEIMILRSKYAHISYRKF